MMMQLWAVTVRALRQLIHDRRFLGISLTLPVLVIGMLWVFFEGVEGNPFVNPRTFVIPVAAYIEHFLAFILCAIALVRERTAQTLGRMFTNGYRRPAIIGGYVLAYSLLGTLQSLVVLTTTAVLFQLDYALSTFLQVYVVIWLLAVISIALGIFASNFARTEAHVFPFVPLFILMSAFFSGIILPAERLPEWAAWGRFLTPMYYANEAILAIIGSSAHNASMAAVLLPYGMILLALATWTLREQEA